MPTPLVLSMSYPTDRLREWSNKDLRLLTSSAVSDYLKVVLAYKVAKRSGGRRFFGEAYVASRIAHHYGYYGSFKWLTNPRFSGTHPFPKGPTKRFKEEFRAALLEHFGERQLRALSQRARKVEDATGVRPVAPDLWLIDKQGNHRFIEVKLPGDRISTGQEQGLALIGSCLRPDARLSVEVVELRPEHDQTSRTLSKATSLIAPRAVQ